MEAKVRTKKIGGSFAIFIPKEIVRTQNISSNDILNVEINKTGNLDFMWGKGKDIKKPTQKIMEEIDEGEDE